MRQSPTKTEFGKQIYFASFLPFTTQQGPPKVLFYLWETYLTLTSSLKAQAEPSEAPLAGSLWGMIDVCQRKGGGRANTAENTQLGRMLLSLRCFVNRQRCNCTLDLYCSRWSPLTLPNGKSRKRDKLVVKTSQLGVEVTTFPHRCQRYPQFLLFDQVWKRHRSTSLKRKKDRREQTNSKEHFRLNNKSLLTRCQ